MGSTTSHGESPEPFLSTFAKNVQDIESWLKEVEIILETSAPDGRLLKLKNNDILPVFDEAMRQLKLEPNSELAKQYRSIIPRLQQYIARCDAAIKSWDALRASETPAVDTNEIQPHDEAMTTPTREEIDAKLELIETRMDGRVLSIENLVRSSIAESQETRRDIKSLKWTILFTAVATVVALWGVNAAIFSNMVASFESGKNTATGQADVKKQTEETAALIRKMQEQLDAQPAADRKDAKPADKK
ncbi:hypothetical protein GTP44_04010 [Duganella sp. FT50W]|uniref:Uncharacterized protein n=1 Tax=Duganella lactea TaxID=2692173 RepID=A0A6L8ME97_9BURK|nr:hypothetical protein [Duganella lactea]MYM81123.1 hypothetical protein [Duganella lactea]